MAGPDLDQTVDSLSSDGNIPEDTEEMADAEEILADEAQVCHNALNLNSQSNIHISKLGRIW